MDDFDAIVLAGGTARRLGGTPKHAIVVDGQTLLARTLAAVAEAARVVVVGDEVLLRPLAPGGTVVREDPPLAGPAAGIGAALPHVTAKRVIVLACDHPYVADAVAPLLNAVGPDGAIAIDVDGRRQNLTFVARTDALRSAVERQPSLIDLAVHSLIEPLDLAEISVPARALMDVDAWEDLGHG
ncbi:MAG TPA: NTP transferase domain-containing protein [Aeromicrobium sp.]|nr:NTP transferase domain-containing protein [Aeromicrobium sp.]